MSDLKYIYNTHVSIVKMAALIGPLVHVDPTEMCSLGVRRGAMQAVGLIFSCKVKPHTPHNIRSRKAMLISNEFKAFYTLFEFLVHLGFSSTDW